LVGKTEVTLNVSSVQVTSLVALAAFAEGDKDYGVHALILVDKGQPSDEKVEQYKHIAIHV
jgi:hypothetical protein